ncbi:MAG: phytoene desaturase [Spirochaetales bacterium]|nr:phytoene desaturase [Spirochaetales bacterium]
MKRTAILVGAGLGGLAAAALLGRDGWQVTVLEKNDCPGGRARLWSHQGYQFDMGPSWYLMPEVFEHYFSLFGRRREEYYALQALDPYYRVFFAPESPVDIGPDRGRVEELFESFERGGAERLRGYLRKARYKYDVAMSEFLYKEYASLFEFLNLRMLLEGSRMNVFGRLDRSVRRYFHDRRARQLLEYAMVFLGTDPARAPALYSIMSHVDLNLGVHYPSGGLQSVGAALARLAAEQGAEIRLNQNVRRIVVEKGVARKVLTEDGEYGADVVLVNADYAFAETQLLEEPYRSYPPRYWERRVLAPSFFVLYLGVGKRLERLVHHNLYFSEHWERHFDAIFRKPSWPAKPCFYVSCISKTDAGAAPRGKENVFVLVPVAPGLDDPEEVRERYAEEVLGHVEAVVGEEIHSALEVRRIFSHRDFTGDYNAYQGTALGLAHTLTQTAVFRPRFRSRKVQNLYYVGQYTHPGIGVPMVLIAAQVVCGLIQGARQ